MVDVLFCWLCFLRGHGLLVQSLFLSSIGAVLSEAFQKSLHLVLPNMPFAWVVMPTSVLRIHAPQDMQRGTGIHVTMSIDYAAPVHAAATEPETSWLCITLCMCSAAQ
jgi:hypothetical protein